MDRKCETCQFFDSTWGDTGKCRRYPPVVKPEIGPDPEYWPLVGADDWCGEYQQDFNRNSPF